MMRLNSSANLIGPCREQLMLVVDFLLVAINSLFVTHIMFHFFPPQIRKIALELGKWV